MTIASQRARESKNIEKFMTSMKVIEDNAKKKYDLFCEQMKIVNHKVIPDLEYPSDEEIEEDTVFTEYISDEDIEDDDTYEEDDFGDDVEEEPKGRKVTDIHEI